MSTITAQQVADLRARTGAGILDAKNALVEANGNEEAAIDVLRKKGQAQAVKKADRQQSEGGIFIATDGKKAALVFVKSETDFVSRSEAFQSLGNDLVKSLLKQDVAAFDAFAKERVPKAVLELGENISIGDRQIVEAPVIGTYVHSNRKIGVIIGLSAGKSEQAVDAAMHAAAMSPGYVSPDEVSVESIAKEREIWKEQMAKDMGKKPPEIIEKIMAGKEKKFREENALLTQPFVKDPSQTVGQMLGAVTIEKYVRVAF